MKKSGVERNIIILSIFIVLAVGGSGFLLNRSLTEIVNSIHKEASTDYRLIVIKNISLDLLEIENSIQLYILTKSRSDLENYQKVSKRLNQRISFLSGFPDEYNDKPGLIDSIQSLVETKLEIWDELRTINVVKNNPKQQFDELYSMLEQKEIDTIKVEVKVEPPPKKGIFRKIFSKKDTAVTRIDTSYVERTVENEEIREEIEALESDLRQQERRKNRRELKLIEDNIQVTGKINNLIAEIEETERDSLVEKNEEADRLATIIFKRLSAFSIMAVILLFVVLILFIRYLRKAGKVQKVLTTAKLGAEKLAQAKEVFMANVSHEMRTPVNAIYGLTEQLLQEDTSENVNEKLEILLTSSKHLKDVVNDTLDFSKIRANKLKISEIDFVLENTINEVLTVLKSEAAAKNIDLIYRSENKLPAVLLGDPFRLKQVLINIIGNAIKFTEEGSVTLVVKSEKIKGERYRISFEIIDTGIGVSKENLEVIFDDFVQIETDYTRKFGGTGLGLSIVKKLIELQNGEISISSQLEQGTKIEFYIPYNTGSSENIEYAKVKDVVAPEKVKELKILGVDDDEYNRYLLKVIFDKWELVNYVAAKNGSEALKFAIESDFDLILMDLRMPNMNGIEASKLITKEKPESKIIALATINSEAEMKMCEDAGMLQALAKPFAESELLNTIMSVLNIEVDEQLEPAGFDLKELERLANGDSAFVKEMIEIFTRTTQIGIETLKEALESEDWQGISDAAHKMAAPCKHIQADNLYKNLKKLEKCTEEQSSLQQVPGLISFVDKEVNRINTSLASFSGV